MHALARLVPALALLAALGACSLAPVRPVTEQQVQAKRVYRETIDIGGRLSVRYQQQGEQLLNGSFTWAQRPDNTQVSLLSPFGQEVARIGITPAQAVFQRAGQTPQTAIDVDALAARALGWPLPVSGLRSWLQGFVSTVDGKPIAANPAAETALTSIDGWRVIYSSWAEDDSTAALRPRRIDLSRRTEEAGEVEIRIVIDAWQPMGRDAAQ
ncbi:lipoprotein insertase outer membrane protein LolB [Lacisediminimonas sp.]|uniref:lipoprotein insertase outer membrane protein LolB n=1 Tax=Lacisediminimonas sp. TaxID=3060582 RepID=UPI0027201E4B|nr:lipoprotein insertase outer membrane protein LolB [Lacisediminimonas sp.]MDO8298657.1 lipoprotein insertase outer membrane protein LolB [Lacisediminimonas sp.]MDO9215673.1 lipoprotein insertase outer membrane protein LolB [Lacisediminimonas sp.]